MKSSPLINIPNPPRIEPRQEKEADPEPIALNEVVTRLKSITSENGADYFSPLNSKSKNEQHDKDYDFASQVVHAIQKAKDAGNPQPSEIRFFYGRAYITIKDHASNGLEIIASNSSNEPVATKYFDLSKINNLEKLFKESQRVSEQYEHDLKVHVWGNTRNYVDNYKVANQ